MNQAEESKTPQTPAGGSRSYELLAEEQSEAARLEKENQIKQQMMHDKERIYRSLDLERLIVEQITTILFRFDMLLAQRETSTITRIKIYELLAMMLRLQNRDINLEIARNQKVIL